MNLLTFILFLSLLYFLYYGINFFLDYLKTRHGPITTNGALQQLTFSEEEQTKSIEAMDPEAISAFDIAKDETLIEDLNNWEFGEDNSGIEESIQISPISALGGVSMKKAIEMAMEGSRIYTTKVTY